MKRVAVIGALSATTPPDVVLIGGGGAAWAPDSPFSSGINRDIHGSSLPLVVWLKR